jgi:hypothetical protein
MNGVYDVIANHRAADIKMYELKTKLAKTKMRVKSQGTINQNGIHTFEEASSPTAPSV